MISSKEKTEGESLPGGVRFSRWSGKAPPRRWHLSQDLQDGEEPRWWAGWGGMRNIGENKRHKEPEVGVPHRAVQGSWTLSVQES